MFSVKSTTNPNGHSEKSLFDIFFDKREELDDITLALIMDIAFFRDINNDFEDRKYHEELSQLESKAFQNLVHNVNNLSGNNKVEVAIIGNFSSGKSSFVNSLLGQEVCPTAVNPTTSSITKFIYSDREKIELKSLDPNEESKIVGIKEYWDKSQHKTGSTGDTDVFIFDYFFPSSVLRNISLHDTPGFENPKNKNDHLITEKISENADVIFVLIDIASGDVSAKLLKQLKKIKKKNKNIQKWFLIANKADTKPPGSVKNIMNNLKKKYSDRFDYFFPYSSKEVIAYRDNPYEQLMEKLQKKIASQLSSGCDDLKLEISGKKSGRKGQKYSFLIDDENIDLNFLNNRRFLGNKNSILCELHKIGNDKVRINDKRRIAMLKEYRNKVADVIELITNELLVLENENFSKDDLSDKCQKSFQTFKNSLRFNLSKKIEGCMRKFYYALFVVRDATQRQKKFFFTPYGIVFWWGGSAAPDRKVSQIKEVIESELLSYAKELQDTIGFSFTVGSVLYFCLEQIKQNIEENIAHIKDYLVFYCDSEDIDNNAIFFPSKNEAELQLKVAIDTLKDDKTILHFTHSIFKNTIDTVSEILADKINLHISSQMATSKIELQRKEEILEKLETFCCEKN